jgi:hypothetical protein
MNTQTKIEVIDLNCEILELTEEQVAIARLKLSGREFEPIPKPRTPEQDSDLLHEREARMRGLK